MSATRIGRVASGLSMDLPIRHIRPRSGRGVAEIASLWREHEILYFLTWRDVKVRYKSTALGIGWAVLQPLATMLIFTAIFGRIGNVPSEGIPYPIFAFSGLLPWQLFAHALTDASNSLVTNQNLITKVYFPRLALPVSAVLAGVLDFGVSAIALAGLMLLMGVGLSPAALAAPLFAAFALLAAFAAGIWLSALNVEYRDVRYVLPFLTQIWLLITPVAYPARLVPDQWRLLFGLNPMAGAVEGFRWALFGTPLAVDLLLVSLGVTLVALISGLYYFGRMEREFADVI